MAKKVRITVAQIMAILALMGILLSAIGTAWITQLPTTTPEIDNISWETAPSEIN